MNIFKKKETLIILAILLLAAFFRLYRISEYMTFLGDEGRDALVIKEVLINYHLPLIGPPTSVGNMYLGPLYYYMMSVAMAVVWLNPVAAAVMDALIGLGTICLVYYFSRKWFGSLAACLSSILYAVSPVTIYYSRSSWNPNPAPFFALLALLGLDRARSTKNFNWFILTGAAIAGAVQMHYLALILIPVFLVLWLIELINHLKKEKYKNFWIGTILAVVVFFILMSPLLLFDLRHDFMNFKAVKAFFSDRQTTVNLNIFNTLGRILPIFSDNLISRYLAGENGLGVVLGSILVLAPVIFGLYLKFIKKIFDWPIFALSIWMLIGLVGLSLYKQTIYDHYLGFLNPAPYLLLGANFKLLDKIKKEFLRKMLVGLLVGVGVILLIFNLQKNPLLVPPNNQLKRTQDVAKFLIAKSGNQPFNFALISEHNYDAAYQFYLGIYGHQPAKLENKITDQLLVVCEDKVCQPINNPKYEIAGFGWAKIDYETDFEGVKIFRLIHNPDQIKNAKKT